jgi:uncharacterized membrane protein
MDIGIILSIAMLLVWGIATFAIGDAPGWLHLLLTVGLFLLFWRIAKLGEKKKPGTPK